MTVIEVLVVRNDGRLDLETSRRAALDTAQPLAAFAAGAFAVRDEKGRVCARGLRMRVHVRCCL